MVEAAVPQFALHGLRLVRALSELATTNVEFSHRHFSARLGLLIDFGESMRLSTLHSQLGRMVLEPTSISSVTIKDDFLRVRLALVESVVGSFVPGSGTRIKLPTLNTGTPIDKLTGFEPYHRFYAAHQREFESRIRALQCDVRDAVRGLSAEMMQLAALDEEIRDALSVHIRKQLAVIPQLLGKRFDFLLQEIQQGSAATGTTYGLEHQTDEDILNAWTAPSGWLGRFSNEMQGLLLAELELRLLPVLGLVEAAHEQVGRRR